MPELPEVEVVRSGLEPAITGARISVVDVLDQRSLKRHQAASGIFADLLQGQTVTAAVRRGKFLWFPLANGTALVTHLGMSGQMLLREPGTDDPLTRIRLAIDSPVHGELLVNFVDQRIFGGMAIDRMLPTDDGFPGGFSGSVVGPALVPSQVAHIARDPLDPAFDDDRFFAVLGRKATGLKRVLLDQTVVSGIGNIYADEALWAAKIHYEQPASSLSGRRARLLLVEVRSVLQKALAEGGTSFDAQYVNVNGASGYFAHSLHAYGRSGEPCARCGTLIRREKFMNRSSHFCPRCQRRR
ncbi:formamidopyrimidine-DNA glycosylase [Mycetocola sp. CAN_C7]|uniref:bifunctional DNA-formamidopyrimidine glycosylase/DNA-(apurinic or apyrimidinic site) lyase n=1 Tax=Mycetocola sp. CAN_C7 TaxID=2787724 RepID=UPI0018C8F4C3